MHNDQSKLPFCLVSFDHFERIGAAAAASLKQSTSNPVFDAPRDNGVDVLEEGGQSVYRHGSGDLAGPVDHQNSGDRRAGRQGIRGCWWVITLGRVHCHVALWRDGERAEIRDLVPDKHRVPSLFREHRLRARNCVGWERKHRQRDSADKRIEFHDG